MGDPGASWKAVPERVPEDMPRKLADCGTEVDVMAVFVGPPPNETAILGPKFPLDGTVAPDTKPSLGEIVASETKPSTTTGNVTDASFVDVEIEGLTVRLSERNP